MAGIFRDPSKAPASKVADFTYEPNDALAQMIVDAWVDKHFKSLLLKGTNDQRRDAAKALFGTRGFFWDGTTRVPIVISEEEYNDGWVQSHPDEICFVLPNHSGICPPGQNLLETARLLMAATPNGI
jgi:hypothetical protein